MICELNNIEVPKDTFKWHPWKPELKDTKAFVSDGQLEHYRNVDWPGQEWAENRSNVQEVKLEKIQYARVKGEPDRPLLGIKFILTD